MRNTPMLWLLWCAVLIEAVVIWLLASVLYHAIRQHTADMDTLRLRQAVLEQQGILTREIATQAAAIMKLNAGAWPS